MRYGSPLPITAFPDFDTVKDYVQTLDGEGFDFTSTSGHVLGQPSGTNPQRPDRQYVGPFYDPMVTFSYLAGMTRRIHFITGILILPAWHTALAAKQSAELAILSRGRFELGIGISWNAAEYRALGQDIRGRGKRIEEQIASGSLTPALPQVAPQTALRSMTAYWPSSVNWGREKLKIVRWDRGRGWSGGPGAMIESAWRRVIQTAPRRRGCFQ